MSYNSPQAEAPNLRKRPSRVSTSKYTKPPATSPPPPLQPTATMPFPVRNYATMDTSALTSSFMLSSPMPTPMPVPGSHSSFASKRKGLKFPFQERNLPEKISSFIPESKLYTALLDFEKKLDLSLARRQLDVQEAMRVRNTLKQNKMIRLSIYNTYSHQNGVYHLDNKTQVTSNEPASWTLRIEGRVEDPAWSRAKMPKKKFSSFVKKAFFQLGEDVNNTIEWDRAVASAETDGWEIKRAGDQEIEVKITLFLEHSPSKVKLSPLLAALLGMHTETRPRILMSLWQYIKANRLLDTNDRKTITCDDNLKIVFGQETMQFSDIPKHLRTHLSPPDPIEISHTLKLSGDPMDHMAVYDIMIEVDDTVAIQPSVVYKKEISNIEEQIAQVVHQVHNRKRKRDFMLEFHNDPVVFLNKLVDNQIRDYKLANAYPGRDPEEERKTNFFYQPYVEDAVQSYVAKHNALQPHVKVNLNIPPSLTTPPPSTTQSQVAPSVTTPQPPPPLPQPLVAQPHPATPPHPSTHQFPTHTHTHPVTLTPLPPSLPQPHISSAPTPPPPLPLPSSLQTTFQQHPGM